MPVAAWLLLWPAILCAEGGGLVFIASLDKSEYTAEEPISATFILRNNGKQAVWVNKRFFFASEEAPKEKKEVCAVITAPSGNKLPFKFPYETGVPKSDYFELLEPGKETKSEFPRNLKGNFEFQESGTYKIKVTYQNVYGGEIGLDAFKGKLMAAPVSFTIVKPGTTGQTTEKK